jgi:hypothetical protein
MPIQGTKWKDMRAFRLLKQIRREIEVDDAQQRA